MVDDRSCVVVVHEAVLKVRVTADDKLGRAGALARHQK